MLLCRQYICAALFACRARYKRRADNATVYGTAGVLLPAVGTGTADGTVGSHEPDGRRGGYDAGGIAGYDRMELCLPRLSARTDCAADGVGMAAKRTAGHCKQARRAVSAKAVAEVSSVGAGNAVADDDILHLSNKLCHNGSKTDVADGRSYNNHNGGTRRRGILRRAVLRKNDEAFSHCNKIFRTSGFPYGICVVCLW